MVPTLDITINHGGGPFIAGLSYNLTCTVTLENATRTPTIGWLDPNNNQLSSGSDITVGDTVPVNCSTYTTTLHFTALLVSHSGQYSCQATLGTVNNTAAVNITVQSKRTVFTTGSGLTFCFLVFSMLHFLFFEIDIPAQIIQYFYKNYIVVLAVVLNLTCHFIL